MPIPFGRAKKEIVEEPIPPAIPPESPPQEPKGPIAMEMDASIHECLSPFMGPKTEKESMEEHASKKTKLIEEISTNDFM